MKKEGKYRFSLQFGETSEEHIRVGELLEKLGNRKSAVVVAALNAYIEDHPELLSPALKITIAEKSIVKREKLEEMIRNIVEERINQVSLGGGLVGKESVVSEALGGDIAQMVSNLELFT